MYIVRKFATALHLARKFGLASLLQRSLVVGTDWAAAAFIRAAARLHRRSHLLANAGSGRLLRRNKVFEGIHAGKRAFIIATGPSLAKQDVGLLRDEITFGVNSFYRHASLDTWNPTYHFLIDRGYFRTELESKAEFTDELLRMSSRIGASKFFVPWFAECAVKAGDLPADNTFFLSFAGWAHEARIAWPQLDRPIPGTFNVVQTALLAALAMGCNPIYLIGCDHDWGATWGEWKHFCEDDHSYENKENGSLGSATAIYESAYFIMKAYAELKRVAARKGVKIINSTNGGRLDVFPRVPLESLFGGRTASG